MFNMDFGGIFFDREAVIDATDKASIGPLSKVGAFLRTRAKGIMRRRKATSPAGMPPSAHSGQLKDLLFFGYDPSTKSVVVGPVKFRDGAVPGLLEFGGRTITVSAWGRAKISNYRGNPFMAPALSKEIEAGSIPSQWSNSIKS